MRAVYKALIFAGCVAVVVASFAPGILPAPILTAKDNVKDNNFDRAACLLYCKEIYLDDFSSNSWRGTNDVHQGNGVRKGAPEAPVQTYQQCVINCEKKFWDNYDKGTE